MVYVRNINDDNTSCREHWTHLIESYITQAVLVTILVSVQHQLYRVDVNRDYFLSWLVPQLGRMFCWRQLKVGWGWKLNMSQIVVSARFRTNATVYGGEPLPCLGTFL